MASAPGEALREGRLELLVATDDAGSLPSGVPSAVGALVEVEGPIGRLTYPMEHERQPMLFIAGGTGIAPIYAMLRHALTVCHGEVGVIYSARTSSEFAYAAELSALAADGRIALRYLVTREPGDSPLLCSKGRLDRNVLAPFLTASTPVCFICGPTPFVCATSQLLAGDGCAPR